MKKKRKLGRKLMSFLLTLAMVIGLMPGMGLTAKADTELSETIITTSETALGDHFIITTDDNYDNDGMYANFYGITVEPRNNEYITKVIITCGYLEEGVSDSNTRVSSGTKIITDDGGTITVTNVNASTFNFICESGSQFSQFTVYYLDSPAGYNVTITAGSNMTKTETSGAASQTDLSGAMENVVYIADDGYKFPETSDAYTTTNGITVTRTNDTTLTISGTPTADTTITIPDAVAATTTLQSISETTTWNFSDVTYSESGEFKLTEENGKSIETVYADFEQLTFEETFNANAIAFKGESPIRSNSKKYCQDGTLRFNTTVPGTIKVKFSDTGTSASATAVKRYLVVNGEQTEYWTSRENNGVDTPYDAQLNVTAGEISVPAGDVTITGSSAITISSVTFTAAGGNVDVTGVSLAPSTAQTIDVDGTVSFTATVAPDNATDKTVKWSVGGTNAAAVKLYSDEACTAGNEVGTDATSTLTVYAKGISAGSATVTATSNADSTKTASCDVTVNEAQAQTDPYASLKNTTTVIKFDDKDWYLIDYDDSTVTLLSKKCVDASKFDSNGSSNTYSGSTVESFVNSWYSGNITSDAKAAVDGNGMFLLTKGQANELSSDVRKCDKADGAEGNIWWLCSTGSDGNNYAACVAGGTGYVFDDGYLVTYTLGVRPALKLDLSKVTFDSDTKTFSLKQAVTEYLLWVGDTQVTSANATSDEHPTWSYDAKTNTLTLNNFSYTGKGSNYAGSISSRNTNAEVPLTINLVGENTVCHETSDYYSYGIYHYNSSNQSLIISGEGSLDVSSKSKNGYGIYSPNNDIIINGGNVTATGNNAIKGTVKNAIAGTGWTNVEGTEGEAAIAVSAEGQTLTYKKVQFEAVEKTPATVTKAPSAKTLTYTGSAQALVTAGEAGGGTMYYAVTTENTAPTDESLYTTEIPTATDAGT